MDWPALALSLELAVVTLLLLLPAGVWAAHALSHLDSRARPFLEALVVLPLVLPPTVLGYYLLATFGGASPVGRWLHDALGVRLTFNFAGLVLASLVFNVPFVVQPVLRAFDAVARDLVQAAAVSGMTAWQTFVRIELPLAWPGVLSAAVLTFVHTLGEFGVVLMIGGSIPGETRTIAISIYDRVQAFDLASANRMSVLLLALSVGAIAVSTAASARWLVRR